MQIFRIFFTIFFCSMFCLQAQEKEEILKQLQREIEILKKRDQERAEELDAVKQELQNLKEKKSVGEFDPGTELEGDPGSQFLIEDDFTLEEEEELEFYKEQSLVQGNSSIIEEESKKMTNGALTLSGFFTLEFNDYQMSDSTLRDLISPESTFSNSHINLYLDARFLENFRFFTEMRFLYAPSSEFLAESLKFSRSGEVLIERAWAEWTYRSWFKIRAGNFLIPYGIWNMEHGAPILLTTRTPIVLRFQIFPERSTGIQFLGTIDIDDHELLYYAWVGNGKGSRLVSGDDQDPNNNKSIGGRLEWRFPQSENLTELAFGISSYLGKVEGPEYPQALSKLDGIFTSVYNKEGNNDVLQSLNNAGFNSVGEPNRRYTDQVIGIDLRLRFYGFLFQGEFIYNSVDPSHARSFKEFGGYMQYAYEFNMDKWGLLTPFVRFGGIDANDAFRKELATTHLFTMGLNWKPFNSVVLKAEYFLARFKDAHYRDFEAFLSSLSVSF